MTLCRCLFSRWKHFIRSTAIISLYNMHPLIPSFCCLTASEEKPRRTESKKCSRCWKAKPRWNQTERGQSADFLVTDGTTQPVKTAVKCLALKVLSKIWDFEVWNLNDINLLSREDLLFQFHNREGGFCTVWLCSSDWNGASEAVNLWTW